MQHVSMGSWGLVLAVWSFTSAAEVKCGDLPWLDGDIVGVWEFLVYGETQ